MKLHRRISDFMNHIKDRSSAKLRQKMHLMTFCSCQIRERRIFNFYSWVELWRMNEQRPKQQRIHYETFFIFFCSFLNSKRIAINYSWSSSLFISPKLTAKLFCSKVTHLITTETEMENVSTQEFFSSVLFTWILNLSRRIFIFLLLCHLLWKDSKNSKAK